MIFVGVDWAEATTTCACSTVKVECSCGDLSGGNVSRLYFTGT